MITPIPDDTRPSLAGVPSTFAAGARSGPRTQADGRSFDRLLADIVSDPSASDRTRLENQRTFSQTLGTNRADGLKPAAQRARDGAEQLVAAAFVVPLLKNFREDTWAAEPFKQTDGERTFRGIADAEVARQIVRGGSWPLVDAVARRLLAKTPGVETPGGPTSGNQPAAQEQPAAQADNRSRAAADNARTGDPAIDGRIALERARDAARGIDFRLSRPADQDR